MNQSVLNGIANTTSKRNFKTKEEVNGFLMELYPFEFSNMTSEDKKVVYKACNIE